MLPALWMVAGARQLFGSAPLAEPCQPVRPGLGCWGGREQPGAARSWSRAEEPAGPAVSHCTPRLGSAPSPLCKPPWYQATDKTNIFFNLLCSGREKLRSARSHAAAILQCKT